MSDHRPCFTRDTAGDIRVGQVVETDYADFGKPRSGAQRCQVVEIAHNQLCQTGTRMRVALLPPISPVADRTMSTEYWFDAGWFWRP